MKSFHFYEFYIFIRNDIHVADIVQKLYPIIYGLLWLSWRFVPLFYKPILKLLTVL